MMNKFPRRSFVTSDNVQLSYIRQGNGRPIVLVHGWSQCEGGRHVMFIENPEKFDRLVMEYLG